MARFGRLGRIDDSFDAAKKAYPKDQENVVTNVALYAGAEAAASCMEVPSGLSGLIVEVIKGTREYFSKESVNERVDILIDALNDKIEDLFGVVARNGKEIDDIKSRIASSEFTAAIREATVQTILTTEEEKIGQFGEILSNAAIAQDWTEISGNLKSFIREVAQLTQADIKALALLNNVFAEVFKTYPNMHDPNPFTERLQDLMAMANTAGFHPDDFYSHCRRLEGFGLAMEVPRNASRMALGDYCFRPTRRGFKLVALLGDRCVTKIPASSQA